MRAAVIQEYGEIPALATVPDPVPGGDEVLVEVRAAAVHQLVRARADGRHYSVHGVLPSVPGVDGVGRLADGTPVYFQSMTEGRGSLAELVAVPSGDVLPLPPGADPVAVAAGVNPCLGAWLSLTVRARLRPTERVIVLGATGSSGALTVATARRLGAGHVTAVARNRAALAALDADERLCLADDDPQAWARAFAAADVVVDFLWGAVAERAFTAIAEARRDPGRTLRYVQVGQMAGATAALPAGPLRAADIRILGSGFGAFTPEELRAELPEIIAALADGSLTVPYVVAPLADIAAEWPVARPERLVLTVGDAEPARAR